MSFYHIPNLNESAFAETLAQFCRKYPDIKVSAEEKTPREIVKTVADTPDCLGLLALPKKDFDEYPYEGQEIKVCFLYQEKFNICVGASYLLDRKIVSINEMLKHPWVIFEYTKGMSTATLLERYGEPEVFMRTNNSEIFRKLIRDGLAIGMVVDSTTRNKQFKDDNIRFIPIRESNDDLSFYLHLIASARYCLSPATELLVEAISHSLPQSQQIKLDA